MLAPEFFGAPAGRWLARSVWHFFHLPNAERRMVIGKHFVWGHLAKTGGDATLAMFRLLPGLEIEADSQQSHNKHAIFWDREHELAGKRRILNLRRLPCWVLSIAMHRARHGEFPDYRPLPMMSADAMADSQLADGLLVGFAGPHVLPIHRWLRTEHLSEDFLAFAAELTEISDELRGRILSFEQVNAWQYEHDIEHWFTEKQLRRLYRRNPLWASYERRIYGDLLVAGHTAPLPRAYAALTTWIHRLPRRQPKHAQAA